MSNVRLTPEKIDKLVADYHYMVTEMAPTLTVCIMKLTTGGVIVGKSNCIDPANHDPEIGRQVAYKDAKEQIWELEGYAMKRDRHLAQA